MRIIVCEFRQETNSFNPSLSTMESFERGGIYKGEEFFESIKDQRCAVTGMLTAIQNEGGEAIPCYSMASQSGGIVENSVVEAFLDNCLSIIRATESFDGVFVSLHGATQSTLHDDVCGYILSRMRSEIGNHRILAASLDMHANITPAFINSADILCGYHTYPHEDYYETGYRAAKLGICQIRSKNLCMAYVPIPLIVPANSYSTHTSPLSDLMAFGKAFISNCDICDFSIFIMQPWLNVSTAASSIIVIGRDAQTARAAAHEIAQQLLNARDQFQLNLYTIDEVIDLALHNQEDKPIILVDSADSTNAGAAGDSMAVVKRILERGIDLKTAFVVDDAPASAAAHKAGVGSTITVSLGGTKDRVRSEPILVSAYVKSLHDGVFIQEGPSGRGLINNIGMTAVLRINDMIDIVVCHNMAGNGDPQLYRAFGVEPLFYKLVTVKACTSFRTAYHAIGSAICMTDTPGAACSDMFAFNFDKLPKPFYPFSKLEDFRLPEAVCAREA
jgi:microcystin degradation protein MlrC